MSYRSLTNDEHLYSSTFVNSGLKLSISLKTRQQLLVEEMEGLQESVFQKILILLIGSN